MAQDVSFPGLIRLSISRTVAIAVLALVASVLPAWAHRAVTGRAGPNGAIVIPNLSHGQMRAIADNASAVLDLADRQDPTDPTMRRLQGFVSIQRFACAWGLMPGSVTDEGSPFNECAHAYLAATRALLVHLQAMPGNAGEKSALVGKIETEMLNDGASLVLCRYSDEPFNTAEYVAPHWADIPTYPPTALALGGMASAMAGCASFGLRRRTSTTSTSGAERHA